MESDRAIVVDANVLIRAVLGVRAYALMKKYVDGVTYWTAEIAFEDARRHLEQLLADRKGVRADAIGRVRDAIQDLRDVVVAVPESFYGAHEAEARQRLRRRDESDWPYVALAMKLQCPIWTEDQDFFGTGIATWTSDRVEIFLGGA